MPETTNTVHVLSQFEFDDVTVTYLTDGEGRVSLRLLPTEVSDQANLIVDDDAHRSFDPLVHVSLVGETQPVGFTAGRSMRQGPTSMAQRLVEQVVEGGTVITRTAGAGLAIEHRLRPVAEAEQHTLEIHTSVTNASDAPVRVQMLTSFSLGGLTSLADGDGAGRMSLHRFATNWCDEGRLVSDTIEHLGLEPASGHSAVSTRFGQLGTMPTREWFPTLAVSDDAAQVFWGARLGWAGSWQMELWRRDADLCLSGGLADREFGHWAATVEPGASVDAPPAWITTARDLDDVWHRLQAPDRVAVIDKPAIEADLPLIFNEWCTSWGNPQHDQLARIAERVAPLGVKYLVIDTGWYRPEDPSITWFSAHGDWIPNAHLFPEGIGAAAAAIREHGLIPGLWFEMEVVGRDSEAFGQTDHLVKRDGVTLTTDVRRFWDLTDPWAHAYVKDRVFDRLRNDGFGYIKVDYNETIGIGVDHADGLGEGLRQHVQGIHSLFEELAASNHDLVIENCASGGHRLEASMLHRTSMSSFSDAHETTDLPIIAAAMHRLMLPRQSQIWAVLRAKDDDDRLVYSLAAGFLGRLCLSGDILDLTDQQFAIVEQATALYQEVVPIIRDGRSRIVDHTGEGRRHPSGWQAVTYDGGDQAMVVVHAYEGAPASASIALPAGSWQVATTFGHTVKVSLSGDALEISNLTDFSAAVVLLTRADG